MATKDLFQENFDAYWAAKRPGGNDFIWNAVANLEDEQLFAKDAVEVVAKSVCLQPPTFAVPRTVTVDDDKAATQGSGSPGQNVRVTCTIPINGEASLAAVEPRSWPSKESKPQGILVRQDLVLVLEFSRAEFSSQSVMKEYLITRTKLTRVEDLHRKALESINQGTRVLIEQYVNTRREQIRGFERVIQEIETEINRQH